jgi:hypothetical protein
MKNIDGKLIMIVKMKRKQRYSSKSHEIDKWY